MFWASFCYSPRILQNPQEEPFIQVPCPKDSFLVRTDILSITALSHAILWSKIHLHFRSSSFSGAEWIARSEEKEGEASCGTRRTRSQLYNKQFFAHVAKEGRKDGVSLSLSFSHSDFECYLRECKWIVAKMCKQRDRYARCCCGRRDPNLICGYIDERKSQSSLTRDEYVNRQSTEQQRHAEKFILPNLTHFMLPHN